jgi:hypothetical protein
MMRLSSSNSTHHSCLHWVTINASCSVTVGTLYLLGVRLVFIPIYCALRRAESPGAVLRSDIETTQS